MISLISWVLFGLIVGIIAKILHPGDDEPIGFLPTVLIGIGGSFVGGLLGGLIFGGSTSPAGFIGSVIGGVICCYAYSQFISLSDKNKEI